MKPPENATPNCYNVALRAGAAPKNQISRSPVDRSAEIELAGDWQCHMRNTCDLGLMGMQVGGKRALKVPAHLAYGERSMGAHITPNSDLTFEIELLEVLTRDD